MLVADFEEGATGGTPGLNHPVSGTTVIENGVWYHAAATYDGTTWRLTSTACSIGPRWSSGNPARADSTQHAGLATAHELQRHAGWRLQRCPRSGAHLEQRSDRAADPAAMTGPVTSAPGLVARGA